MQHNATKITPKQLRAAEFLAEGWAVAETAKKLKIRRETLYRWKLLPAFDAAYTKALENMRTELTHEFTKIIRESLLSISNQLDNEYAKCVDCAALGLEILKFFKADQLFLPAVPPEKQ